MQSFLSEAASASLLVIYSGRFEDGADLYARARGLSLEGVVLKRTDAPYRSGRTEDWIKVKCWKRNRYVVVGFVPGAGGISALRLGRREGRELLYAGKVGTGFDRRSAAEVRRKLEPLAVKRSPLTTPIKKPSTVWVQPKFEAEIRVWPHHPRRAGPASLIQAPDRQRKRLMLLTMRPTGGHSPVNADRQDWAIPTRASPFAVCSRTRPRARPLTCNGAGPYSGRMPASSRADTQRRSTRRRPNFNVTGSPG